MARNEITENIIKQLGNMTLRMLGAKDLCAIKDGLSFKIRGSRKVNYVRITLNGLDLYDVEYFKIGPVIGMNPVADEDNIYFDGLHESIERNTGLHTSL